MSNSTNIHTKINTIFNQLLINFINKYSEKWEWKYLSANPNITMEVIETYPTMPWDWEYIYQ